MMYTLGHNFVPPGIHAGGLRYHGDAPLLCLLVHEKIIEARAVHQVPVFEAARLFARTEGIVPAPETAHALLATVDEAIRCREANEAKCIVVNFSGHGFLDLGAYDAFLEGKLEDFDYPEEVLQQSLAELPKIPGQ
jgi:tryptophan synthase beta chain